MMRNSCRIAVVAYSYFTHTVRRGAGRANFICRPEHTRALNGTAPPKIKYRTCVIDRVTVAAGLSFFLLLNASHPHIIKYP